MEKEFKRHGKEKHEKYFKETISTKFIILSILSINKLRYSYCLFFIFAKPI